MEETNKSSTARVKRKVSKPPSEENDYDDKDEPKSLTFAQTILSIIPFTNEYKTAHAAFEMLDNLKRITGEKDIARNLMTRTKIGEHEEVSIFIIYV